MPSLHESQLFNPGSGDDDRIDTFHSPKSTTPGLTSSPISEKRGVPATATPFWWLLHLDWKRCDEREHDLWGNSINASDIFV